MHKHSHPCWKSAQPSWDS